MSAEDSKAHVRLHRLLKRDLGAAIAKNERGTWTTTSSLPHEIRPHSEAGVELVRVSAGAVIGVRQTKALLETVNTCNVERALTRTIWIDGKVLVSADMPLASLRRGDLEHLISAVFCCARLDAPALAQHGGRPTTEPPPALAPDFEEELHSWSDLLRASGTATQRELAVWLDQLTGADCWIDRESFPGEGPVVVIDQTGTCLEWPFTLGYMVHETEELMQTVDDDEQ